MTIENECGGYGEWMVCEGGVSTNQQATSCRPQLFSFFVIQIFLKFVSLVPIFFKCNIGSFQGEKLKKVKKIGV